MSAVVLRPPEFVADGRTIPSKQVTDIMSEMLQLTPSDKLLEIGTGSASQTHVWAKSGCKIYTIELKPVIEPWRLSNHGLDQVFAYAGDGKLGLPDQAPYTAIVVTCGIERIPEAWIDQLELGGRIVVPLGTSTLQKLTLIRKNEHGGLEPQRIAAYVRFSMIRN